MVPVQWIVVLMTVQEVVWHFVSGASIRTYCSRHVECPNSAYCDPGYGYCMHCDFICKGEMQSLVLCRESCHTYNGTSPNQPTRKPTPSPNQPSSHAPTDTTTVPNETPAITLPVDTTTEFAKYVMIALIAGTVVILFIPLAALLIFLVTRSHVRGNNSSREEKEEKSLMRTSTSSNDSQDGNQPIKA